MLVPLSSSPGLCLGRCALRQDSDLRALLQEPFRLLEASGLCGVVLDLQLALWVDNAERGIWDILRASVPPGQPSGPPWEVWLWWQERYFGFCPLPGVWYGGASLCWSGHHGSRPPPHLDIWNLSPKKR